MLKRFVTRPNPRCFAPIKASQKAMLPTGAAPFSFKSTAMLRKPAVSENASYADKMFEQYRRDPASVHESWREYFAGESSSSTSMQAQVDSLVEALRASGIESGASGSNSIKMQSDGFKLMTYIRAFMTHGHLNADVDPLQLDQVYSEALGSKFKKPGQDEKQLLDYKHYGFTEQDLDQEYIIDIPNMEGLFASKQKWTLREIRDSLEKAYCGKIGVEYMHMPDPAHTNFIRKKFEMRQYNDVPNEKKKLILDRLLWADEFSNFIGTKFNTMKRFGLEGCESFIPGMKSAMDTCLEHGASKAVIGMPHRGRLNMLANVVRKPLETIFAEFIGTMPVQENNA